MVRTLQWTPNLSDETLPADPVDVAAREQDQRCDHLLKDRASVKLRQIERALRRLNESAFGVCLGCREDTSIERLKVQPGCAAESCSPSRFAHIVEYLCGS